MAPLLVLAVVGGLLGAKLHYIWLRLEENGEDVFFAPGLVWQGGAIAGTLSVIVAVKVLIIDFNLLYANATVSLCTYEGIFIKTKNYRLCPRSPWPEFWMCPRRFFPSATPWASSAAFRRATAATGPIPPTTSPCRFPTATCRRRSPSTPL